MADGPERRAHCDPEPGTRLRQVDVPKPARIEARTGGAERQPWERIGTYALRDVKAFGDVRA